MADYEAILRAVLDALAEGRPIDLDGLRAPEWVQERLSCLPVAS